MSTDAVPFYWITTEAALRDLIDRHAGESAYALDTEFSMGRRYGTTLAVVQLGWPEEIALVDATVCPLAPLADLFSNDATALTHAGANDFDVLDAVLDVRPRRLFDTQLAAQFLGWPTPSLALLVAELLGVTLDKSEQRTDWLVRPLSDAALLYAATDVAHLHELTRLLGDELRARDRYEWFEEECALLLARRRAPLAPEELWWNLTRAETIPASRQLGAQRLCVLRDEWAQRLDKPPSFVMNDATVVSLAKKPPRHVDEVLRAAGARPVSRPFATEVVALFRRDGDAAELRPLDKAPLDDQLTPLLGALAALATQRARDLSLDPGLLTSRGEIGDYLSGLATKLDGRWRRACVTDDFDRLRRGDASLVVRDDRLVVA